jgi:5-methylcytosine-specific restriction protein A
MPTMPTTFRAPWMPDRAEAERATDRARGTARDRGYDSRWDRASAAFLLAHPICPACELAGLIVASQVTDHTIPHKGDRALFWSRDNWQPACRWHHDVVKQRLEQLYAAGKIGAAELVLTSAFALATAAQLRAP